ncbi:ATPase [Bacillus wiedmannii]|uniref:siphovirus Gp157 family protein n=1 Tax=Bacillus wiedmannii TaxID=1890302 RepID=UPI000BFC2F1F|nr:siphovirus Gp157 family protein [Bacillus wiedmannii]PHE75180.1 ATPase [Bacillus wiedmannii]
MRLYELTNNYNELQMMIEDGVDPSALQDTLQAIEESIQDKSQNIALLIKNLEADTEAIKLEEKRLVERRRAVENNCKSLKDYLYQQMTLLEVKRIKGELITVSIQNNPPSLDVLESAIVPTEYLVMQAPKIDKKSLLSAIKNGLEVEGVTIKQTSGVRLR